MTRAAATTSTRSSYRRPGLAACIVEAPAGRRRQAPDHHPVRGLQGLPGAADRQVRRPERVEQDPVPVPRGHGQGFLGAGAGCRGAHLAFVAAFLPGVQRDREAGSRRRGRGRWSSSAARKPPWRSAAGDRYFVENILEELDSPGEWYLDRAGRKLYLWPKTPLTSESQVIAPRLTRFVEFRGTEEQPVRVRAAERADLRGDRLHAGRRLRGLRHATRTASSTLAHTNGRCRRELPPATTSARPACTARSGATLASSATRSATARRAASTSTTRPAARSSPTTTSTTWAGSTSTWRASATGEQVHGALIAHNHVHDTTRWGISVGHTTSTQEHRRVQPPPRPEHRDL